MQGIHLDHIKIIDNVNINNNQDIIEMGKKVSCNDINIEIPNQSSEIGNNNKKISMRIPRRKKLTGDTKVES